MSELLPFIISGIAAGAIYGLAGTGLVLTYKTSGIFNFAHGAVATTAAYFFYWLHIDQGVDWKLAFVASVFVLGPVLGLLLEVGARHLAPQRTAMRIVGTVGLLVLVRGLATLKYGTQPLRVAQYLPGGRKTFRFGGVNVGYDQVIVTVVSLVAVAALYALFRYSRMGIAMRAVVDDPDLVGLHGTSAQRVRRVAWIIGSTFAAASGVLIAPLVGIDAIILTYLIVQAFGAAAIGAFSSIPLTYVGGMAIGIAASVSKKYVVTISWLSGLPPSLPFIALFLVLLLLPKRRLVRSFSVERRPAPQQRAPAPVQAAAGVVVVAFLLFVPMIVGTNLSYYTVGLTQAILLLSLGLLVRTSGQVSLCHAAFAAIGAVSFAQIHDLGVPWLPALLLGSLVVIPVAALLAVPAIRLSGLFLALATFGFGIMVEQLLYPLEIMFTPQLTGRGMPRPSIAISDQRYYYVVLLCLVATAACMIVIDRSRLGRLLRGMSDSPTAVTAMGLNTRLTKVIVFCISGFFAGMAGILYGSQVHFATYNDGYYTSFTSLILLAILAIAPFATPWYAIAAGVAAVLPAYLPGNSTPYWLNVVFGLAAVVIALRGGRTGLPPRLQAFLTHFERPRSEVPVDSAVGGLTTTRAGRRVATSLGPGLCVENLVVRFGGLIALDGATLEAPQGRITGLIGPNGAGKTTLFNTCSGLTVPSAGRVSFNGTEVTRSSASARARLGLGRTFQIAQLCESLSVADNVSLGRESGMAGASLMGQLAASRAARREATLAAAEAMELCGISELAHLQAGALSAGQRRLVELARALAGSFDVLLLDEPSSGLDHDETTRFGDILVGVAHERRCGILLVEHDMSLVMNVCSYIYVLDFGKLLFEGRPDTVAASPVVQAAYLGADALPGSVSVP